jgi:hypothetical protein
MADAAVFGGHVRAPIAETKKSPRGGDVDIRQTANLQRLAGGED